MVNKTHKTIARLAIALALLSGLALSLPGFAAQTASAYTTAFRYNLNRQVTGRISPAADSTAPYLAVRNTYNAKGLLTSVEEGVLSAWQDDTIDPANWGSSFTLSRKTVFTHDSLGRAATESVIGTDGNPTGLTQYSYDDQDRIRCKTVRMDPGTYDRLPGACELTAAGTAGPDRITQFAYLIADLVTSETRGLGTSLQQTYVENRYGNSANTPSSRYLLVDQLDANRNLTHYAYDTRGRLQRMYFPQKTVSSTPNYNAADYEEYSYDLNSNRVTLRKRDSNVITYDYDNLNRVWRKQLPNADVATRSVWQGFDLWGHQQYARFLAPTGAGITAVYNGFGELVSETSNASGTSYTLSYQYDRNSNQTRVTHPDNAYFTYQYDQLDRLTDIREGASTGPLLIHYAYDSLARPESLTTAGAVTTTLGYDPVSRPQSISLNPAGTKYDIKYTLGFNPAGQIVSRELSNNNFQYQERGSATGTYVTNGLNQYTQAGSLAFGYDDNGNLTSDGGTSYSYDIENRLIGATGTKNASLKYDPIGHLYQVTGSSTTNFLYSGTSLVAEYQNGIMTKRYVFGAGVDKPLVSYNGATVSGTSRQFLHGDHQGSVVAITDGSGNVVSNNTYDAYGVPGINNQGRFAYTGQTYLPEVGMYYYKARIYYPQVGRFLQTDPVGYKDDMDLYSYVGNDPMNRVDADGQTAALALCAATPVGCAVGVAITIYVAVKAVNDTRHALQSRSSPFKNEVADAPKPDGNSDAGHGDAKRGPKKDGEGSTPEQISNSSGGPTAGKPVPPGLREDILEEGKDENGNYTCWRCGGKTTDPSKIDIGHKNVPRSQGGNLHPDNLACEGQACNRSAGNRGEVKPGSSCTEKNQKSCK